MQAPEVLVIIGARSGSKGIKDKNIKPLLGKPLLAWPIEAAKKAASVCRIVVSTDSADYARVARDYGAETPFLRPAEFSHDTATDFDYVSHAVLWLESNEGYRPDIVVRLMPTVPLQSSEDIDGCVAALLSDKEADAAVGIAEARQHPHKALKLIPDGSGGDLLVGYISGLAEDAEPQPRQKLKPAYFRGNIVASRRQTIVSKKKLVGDRVRAYVIPKDRAIDIDCEADLALAEFLGARLGMS